MAWNPWKKEDADVPAAFKGKTPEEIQQELLNADALKAENERLKGSTTALATAQSELEQAKTRLRALEGNKKDEPAAGPKSIFDNEDEAFAERLGPVQVATMQNSARLARMTAEAALERDPHLGPVLRKFRGEYEDMIKQLTLPQAMNDAAYANVLGIVASRHLGEILTETRKGNNEFFVEGAQQNPGQPKTKDKNGDLDASEKAMAKKMGVTEEAYKKSRDEFQFVGVGA